MTLDEIRSSGEPMLRPADIAPIIGCDPQWVRDTAKGNPKALGFPTLVVGTRVKIPRIPFLNYLGYKEVFPHEPENSQANPPDRPQGE